MAIRVAINHKTTYEYDRFIALSPHIFRLRPAAHSRTPILSYSLKITPDNHYINWQQDPFGNFLARVVFPEKTKVLSVEVEVIADLIVINPFDFFVDKYAEKYPFTYDAQLKKELAPYLEITERGPLLMKWLSQTQLHKEEIIVDFLVKVNQMVARDIAYTIRMEAGVQTCEDTLGKALGSCRDSAWLLVQLFRHLGMAARFVSGYLVQLTADVKALDGPSGPESDFTDLHAWAEVYVPGAGWIGLDATSGLLAGEGHIPLACSPDPISAAPVTGYTEICKTKFTFNNSVTRIHEDPRVTKPYSEEQWGKINALGNLVDEDLQNNDVRMTMGGEPTFVSIDDMEAAEWNIAADGPHKRKLARDLMMRLKDKYAPHGLLHVGQGKWYPGEELPRWQLGLFWRKDGLPMWNEKRLLTLDEIDKKYTHKDAQKFLATLCQYLAVSDENIEAAYEDVFYFLWEEKKLPVDIDPLKANLKDPIERRTMAALLDRGLNEPVGYVLPLKWDYSKESWRSSKWEFRRKNMFLIPGNSPIGMRLPLDSLPKSDEEELEAEFEQDQFSQLPELENYQKSVGKRYESFGKNKWKEEEQPLVKTALGIEEKRR